MSTASTETKQLWLKQYKTAVLSLCSLLTCPVLYYGYEQDAFADKQHFMWGSMLVWWQLFGPAAAEYTQSPTVHMLTDMQS